MSFDNEEKNSSKNFIIAMCLFIAVMFGYDYFTGNQGSQNQEQTDTTQEVAKEDTQSKEPEAEIPESKSLSIDEALNAENRIYLENDHISGSVNLNGGIIDCLTLKDYKETVEKDSKNVMLLTPKDTEQQFYYAISYEDKTNNEFISEKAVPKKVLNPPFSVQAPCLPISRLPDILNRSGMALTLKEHFHTRIRICPY